MLGFLESLQVNPQDNMPATRMQKAIENEKIFIEIFSNPSDEVIKAELEKIQMKWLLNDYQGANKKAYTYKNQHLQFQ